MIGQIVGHFRIDTHVSTGGMGELYLAEDLHLHRRAALKILRAGLLTDPDARARFTREAQAAAALNDPGIVAVYEVGEHNGAPYIAMEFVDGEPIDQYVLSRGCTIEEVVGLILTVIHGLEKAHKAGIIHRDLKPQNILVDSDGRPRIVDFGVAQVAHAGRLTHAGRTVGTLAYMAPEQLEGHTVDARSDVWAIGVLLYELTAGRRPFAGERVAALTYEILHASPFPLSRVNPQVPEKLSAVVSKCLSKVPAHRPRSAAELGTALAEVYREPAVAPLPTRAFHGRALTLAFTAILVLVIGATWAFFGRDIWSWYSTKAGTPIKTLAVLPFQNLGSPEQEYFADGLTDELTERIGRLTNLRVISLASAMTYKNQQKRSREIGRELGAAYILEGTVRWQDEAGQSRVRITPRLIQAEDNHQFWSATYDRLMADVFAIQSDIAENVVQNLGVALFAGDHERLGAQATANLQAYDSYLQANSRFNRSYGKTDIEEAIRLYSHVTDLDPNFAAAWARRSWAHSRMFWFGHDQTAERLALAESAVRRALEIIPDLPDAHLALGYLYYWGKRDYDQALSEFGLAQKGLPSSSEACEAIGYVLRRQGRFDSALVQIQEACRLDPRSHRKRFELGNTCFRLRRWREADSLLESAIVLSPEWALSHSRLARLRVYSEGDVEGARRILNRAEQSVPAPELAEDWVWLEGLAGNYQAALEHCEQIPDSAARQLETARILILKGDTLGAWPHFDSARVWLEASVKDDPESAFLHRYLGLAYAGLGRFDEAVDEGLAATTIMPISKDAFFVGPSMVEGLAQVYTATGRNQDALRQISILIDHPAGLLTQSYLRIAPEYARLRADAAFQDLVGAESP